MILSFQDKNKDELILELQGLEQRYDALKKQYEECIYDKSLRDITLSKLYKYSLELLDTAPVVNLESTITRLVKEITGARAAVFSEYDSQLGCLNVQHIEMEPSTLEKVLSFVGKPLRKIKAPVSDEMYRLMSTETIGIRESLYDASFGAISKPASIAIQKLLKANRFIGIVYLLEGKLYGTTLLALGKGSPDPPRQILENIIFLSTVILKRRKAEEAIKESEERFRALFEGAPDAILLLDPVNIRIIEANKAASLLVMKRLDEMPGMHLYELFSNQPPEMTWSMLGKQLNESEFLGFVRPHETYLSDSDGNLVAVEMTSQSISFKGQRVVMASFRNISERKRSESFTQQLMTELQTLLENIQQGVLLENENRSVQYANKKFFELFNIEPPKNIRDNCGIALNLKLQHYFADPPGFLETVERRLNQQSLVLSEEIMLADGRTFERDFIPIFGNGKKDKNYWVYRDITERKLADKELVKSQAYLAAIINAMPDLMFVQDKDGTYIDYHSPEGTYLYISPSGFIGKTMDEVLPAEISKSFKSVFEKALTTGLVQSFEYSLNDQNREAVFESRTVAYQNDKLLSIVREITERKKNEALIRQQNEELKKLNEDKNRFMSILAHDLKSPFNSILGLLNLLSLNLRSYDIAKTEKMVKLINDSSVKFYQLLEDLLLWARSQSGKMPFEPKELAFQEVSRSVVDEMMGSAQNKNISINLGQGELNVRADVEMLKTVLRNLISNAIKFTHPGGTIGIYAEVADQDTTITVSDNGVGIHPDKINTLFDISVSSTAQGTSGETGTGLGLFLCKELVEKHGGTIWAESEPGKGSRFKFTLPPNT